MKTDIVALYQNLDDNDIQTIEESIEGKYLLTKFFHLLPDLKSLSPVKLVYLLFEDKVSQKNQKTYLNKFYKLHSELKLIIVDVLSKNLNSLSNEERQLIYCKNLIQANNEKLAIRPLEELKQTLANNEIYELQPELLRLQIFLKKRLSPFDQESLKALCLELKNSFAHRRVLEKITILQSETISTHEELKKNIRSFQKIINEYAHSKRFRKLYHFYIVNNKLVFPVQVNKEKHAIVRHLNNLEKLRQINPNIPGEFLHKDVAVLNKFKQALLHFSFNLMIENYQECEEQRDARIALRELNPTVYLPLTFGELYHDFILELMIEDFEKARQKADEMELFLKLEQNANLLIHVDLQRSLVFFLEDKGMHGVKELLKKLKLALRNKNYESIQNKIYEAMFYLLWQAGEMRDARKVFEEQNLHLSFEIYGIEKKDILKVLDNEEKDDAGLNTSFGFSKEDTAFGRILKKRILRTS